MLRYILVRLVTVVVVLWIIVTASFFLMRSAPGGPFDAARQLDPAVAANLERQWGLDPPLVEQYAVSLAHMLRFDFGPSLAHMGQFTVGDILARRLPVSAELGAYAIAIALLLGLGAGILGAARPGTLLDRVVTGLAQTGAAIPVLVLAPLLLYIFGPALGWRPSSGWETAADKILPSVSLGLVYAAAIARLARSGLDDVLSRDFIRTARAKGLSERRVLFGHALRGGLLPVVSYLGPTLAGVLTGSVVVEQVYNVPGVAAAFVAAVQARDYPVVMGVVVVSSVALLLLHVVVDIVYARLDPRVVIDERR